MDTGGHRVVELTLHDGGLDPVENHTPADKNRRVNCCVTTGCHCRSEESLAMTGLKERKCGVCDGRIKKKEIAAHVSL